MFGGNEAVEETLGVAVITQILGGDEAVEEAMGTDLTTQIPLRSRAGSNMTGKDDRKVHPVPGPSIIRMGSVLLAGRGKQSRLRLYMHELFLLCFSLLPSSAFGWQIRLVVYIVCET